MSISEKPGLILGIPASPGLAVGRVCFWNDPEAIPRYAIKPEQVRDELKRLDEALAASRRQIGQLRERVEQEVGQDEAAIFASHRLLLDDPAFYARVEKTLITKNVNLEAAVEEVIEDLGRIFQKIPDPYIQERAGDYRDIGRRILDNLISYQRQCTLDEGEQIILVARELMPSDTVHFHRQHVAAFITEHGGVSSHAAILARSLKLPAVVSVPQALTRLQAGTLVVVDGTAGQVLTEPTAKEIAAARQDISVRQGAAEPQRPAQTVRTADGTEVILAANLTREFEAEEARRLGALGVGLLRTEFLFMDRGEFLNEDAQYQAYRHVVEMMAPHPVTIRTLDIGEDKHFDFENPVEPQPTCVLGWRSLRLSLAYQKVFAAQLRAILRAGAHGPARILLPMVSGVEELRQVRTLVAEQIQILSAAKVPHDPKVPVGAMIETPAAAVLPEILLPEADFLSVGTNDLVQYVMVADRTSERLQPYYRSTAPVILSLLNRLAQAAAAAGKTISICGEIAGDPRYLPLLLGLGYREFSVAPVLLPDLAQAITRLHLDACRELAAASLRLSTAGEVEALLRARHA
ncbi:MAG: phosphoenolpyruvate--protein phosphotransferase [candidate division FCPU426 bacterium]